MFNFIKKFFGQNEEVSEKEKQKLELNDCIEFLKGYSNENDIKGKIDAKKKDISGKADRIRKLLKELEIAEMPRNIRETPAVENKVLSNRAAYIGYVDMLLKKLESREDFEQEFKEFSEKSIKSYYATQYLFGKNLIKVGSELQEMSKDYLELNKLKKQAENNKFKDIEKKILLLQDTLRNKGMIKNEIEILEREIKNNDILSLERKYVQIKNSAEYNESIKKREEAEARMQRVKEEIIELFGNVKRGLRKINNSKKSWLLQYYIDEPIDALLQDNELKIVCLVQEADKKDIEDDALVYLSKINLDNLGKIKERYNNFLTAMKEAEKRKGVEVEVFQLEDTMFRVNSQRAVLGKKLGELKARDSANPELLKKEIENLLTEISGILVEIEL